MEHSVILSNLTRFVFALCLAYLLWRMRHTTGWVGKSCCGGHALMCMAMLFMGWSRLVNIPITLEVVLFSVMTVAYLLLAVNNRLLRVGNCAGLSHHCSPALLSYSAIMMAAMVWMPLAISPGVITNFTVPNRLISILFGVFFAAVAFFFIARVSLGCASKRKYGRLYLADVGNDILMASGMAASLVFGMS